MILHLARRSSPLGDIVMVEDGSKLVHLDFGDCGDRTAMLLRRRFGEVVLDEQGRGRAGDALDAYFAGDLHALDTIEVEPGGTPFQRRLWLALREDGPGRTASYADMARMLGSPKAVRAVGRTNGLNPVALVLPCHRIVGSDGGLTGYAGGIERKAWLLRHEGVLL